MGGSFFRSINSFRILFDAINQTLNKIPKIHWSNLTKGTCCSNRGKGSRGRMYRSQAGGGTGSVQWLPPYRLCDAQWWWSPWSRALRCRLCVPTRCSTVAPKGLGRGLAGKLNKQGLEWGVQGLGFSTARVSFIPIHFDRANHDHPFWSDD